MNLDKNLAELPSYQGDYEARLEVKILPSTRGTISREHEFQKISTLLSTLIKCVLTLGELLKARPHLRQDLYETLQKLGVKEIGTHQFKELKQENQGKFVVQPILINQVGYYCEGEEGNITLPIEGHQVKSLVRLDSGMSVAIVAKSL